MRLPLSENLLRAVQTILQDAIAPDVRELRVEVKALGKLMDTKFIASEENTNIKFVALEDKMDTKFAALEGKMDTRFVALENKMDAKFVALENKMDTKFVVLEDKMDTKFAALEDKMDTKSTAMEDRIDSRYALLEEKISAQNNRSEAQLNVILAAIREAKAQSDLLTVRLTTGLSERLAVLEARRN
jgi:hypothetical protein